MPHPRVELGTFNARPVSLTKSFISPGEALIHGNELLFLVDSEYPKEDNTLGATKHTRTREHTLATIKDGLLTHGVGVDKDLSHTGLTAFGIFVGYLLLDALICNTDRHHENWAAIAQGSGSSNKVSAAYYVWRVYRELEELSMAKSAFYFTKYAYHALLKAKI